MDIRYHSIQNHDCSLAKVEHVVGVTGASSSQAEKSRVVLVLITSVAFLLAFWARFPREAPTRPMEPLTIETYFNAQWENDSIGGFVWVLNEKNKIIVANNKNVKLTGLLDLRIVGAPCGGSHQVLISSKSVPSERVSITANQSVEMKLKLTLDPHERVPVNVDVTGSGCTPSATDDRLIKVQVRQPVFISG